MTIPFQPPAILVGDNHGPTFGSSPEEPLSALSFEDEVRNFRPRLEGDAETVEQDAEFSPTSLNDLFRCVDNEVDGDNLERYLPSKIVLETRNKFRDSVRLGCDQAGFEALESGLETLKTRGRRGSDFWRFGQVEILLDLGKYDEARATLSKCKSTRTQTPTIARPEQTKRRRRTDADADAEFQEMERLAQQNFELSLRAEKWEQARAMAENLHRINPSYFEVTKPMDRFSKCRQLLNLGLLAEIKPPKGDVRKTQRCLEKALNIYNHGCFATELFHEYFDHPEARVYGFDHSDCANLFFSAARVCIHFDKNGIFDKHGRAIMPKQFKCSPALTEQDWRHQALHFLEQGRSRALLDSIIRGERFVTPMQKKLLDDVVFAANESIRIKKRDSFLTTPNSRASSMSSAPSSVDSIQDSIVLPGMTDNVSSLRQESRSSSPASLNHRSSGSRPRPKLNTRDLPQYAISSLSSSPAGPSPSRLDPEAQQRTLSSLRIRMRWRKVILFAFATLNPTLAAALPSSSRVKEIHDMRTGIPQDTAVVEYALASAAPSGLMTFVATSSGIEKATWQELNAPTLQKHIADLRASMSSPAARSRHLAQVVEATETPVDLTELKQALLESLVQPIERHIAGKKRLIIIPSGELAHIPWAMLFQLPLAVVPSLSVWNRLQSHANEPVKLPPKISIVSNAPKDENGRLRDIPYSRMEALYIARIHQQWPFLADNHDRASFESFAEATQVLHLCAHSSFDDEAPMMSSIQLFKQPLTILDWHDIAIKADLVVFSSCLSGISKSFDSGSTFGFAHTLLATGTRAFIGSLWPVEDAATLLLMIMFYEELRKPMSPAEALHNAQTKMRDMSQINLWSLVERLKVVASDRTTDDFVHNPDFWIKKLDDMEAAELRDPRFWAAFVLTGYGFRPIY